MEKGMEVSNLKKILMIAGFAICVAMLVTGIVFISRLAGMNILKTSYIVIIAVLIIGIAAFFAFLQKWFIPGIVTKIIAVMLSVVMVIAAGYLRTTHKALEEMTGIVTQIDNVQVYVSADSSYGDIQDLNYSKYGIVSALDRDNSDKAIDMIAKETGTNINVYEYDGIIQLINGLYEKEISAIILNSAFISILSEIDNFSDIDKRIRSIWTADIETVVSKPDNQEKPDSSEKPDSQTPTVNPYDEYQDYLYGGEDIFTLYISGIDTKGSPTVNRNSDVNILMTVNTKTRQILMINTPRDFYVPLSISNGVKDKLTHAGCYGIKVSIDTLEMLYGVNIDDYIKVNFTGFVEVIDLLGGVDVYSAYEFTSFQGYHFNQGYNSLNGKEALAFSRERYAFGSGDRQRGKNQMAVISAVINKLTSTNVLLNYNSILDSLSSSMVTSMEYDEITDLIKMQLSDMKGWDIVTYSADGVGDNLMTFSLPAPNYVMVPTQSTVDQAKEYLRQIYAGEVISK